METGTEQRQAVKAFVKDWTGKGNEKGETQRFLENPLESDPIVVLIIDPPPSFNSSKKQKQAEVTKNHSSLLSI